MAYPGDFNGDGRTDYFLTPICPSRDLNSSDQWQLFITNPDGHSFLQTDEGYLVDNFKRVVVRDANSDGMDDIYLYSRILDDDLPIYHHTFTYLYSNANQLIPNSSQNITRTTFDDYLITNVCDFDGDGRNDILFTSPDNGFSSTEGIDLSLPPVINDMDILRIIDINGDGKQDILTVKGNNTIIYSYNTITELSITFTTFTPIFSSSSVFNDGYRLYPGDFNGDGKTDILAWYNSQWKIYYSTGSQFTYAQTAPITNPIDPNADPENDNYTIADFNGDGKSDIMEFHFNGTDNLINIYYSTGYSFYSESNIDITPGGINDAATVYDHYDDLNGDGKAELLKLKFGTTESGITWANTTLISFHPEEKSHLVSSITNGFLQSISFTYESIAKGGTFYTKGASSTFPQTDFQGPIYCVKTLSTPNGIGGSSITNYTYSLATIHKQGLGFLGFGSLTSTNTTSNRKFVTSTTLDNSGTSPTYLPISQSTVNRVNSTTRVINSKNISFTNVKDASSGAWLSYPSTIVENDNLSGVTVSTTNAVDGNGNISSILKDFGSGFTENTLFENYTIAGTQSGIPNKPAQITNTRKHPDDANSFSTQSQLTYNLTTGGILTKKENTNLPSNNHVTTTYTYDSFGNVLSVNTASQGIDGNSNVNLTKSSTYEPVKGRFIETSTDGITSIQYRYEPSFGATIYEKASYLEKPTIRYLDVWGHSISETGPDDVTVSNSLNWASNPAPGEEYYYIHTTNSKNSAWAKEWYDQFGRTTNSQSTGFNGIISNLETIFNSDGSIAIRNSSMGGIQTSLTNYTYDSEGRVLTETDSKTGSVNTNTYFYGQNKIQTTSDSKTYTKTYDNWGNLKQVDEPSPGGSIYYTYFSHSKPKGIQSPASLISFTYDPLGQQLSIIDPDAGTTNYHYDPIGRLTYQKDANNNTVYTIYDTYGRVDHMEDASHANTYMYTYFTDGAGIGSIKDIIGQNDTKLSFEYDKLGRIIKNTKKADANNSFTFSTTYDGSGNVSTVSYPGGDVLTKQYDSYGILYRVLFTSDNKAIQNHPIWTLNQQTATSEAYLLGNGQTTTKTFNSNNFTLSSIITSDGTHQIQSSYYDFNPINGNLNNREDRRTGYNLIESFTYDELYRLTGWTTKKYGITNGSYSISYNNTTKSGNITTKSDAGSYAYNIANKPHHLSEIELSATSGIPSNAQNLTYTDFGKVSSISENNYQLSIAYGPDKERCISSMYQNGQKLYDYYFTGLYEKKVLSDGTTKEFTYIPSGDGIAAVYIRATGNVRNLYYIHKDYLGSIVALTNTAGTITEESSFDPWGRRRNPTDWTFTNLTIPTIITRGFTGHEHINEIGLINMNGRFYDPVLGMFISPDNNIQDPSQSINLNRFSYCLNNPLKYTDPTGEFWNFIFGAAFGGVVNWIANGSDFTWKGLGYFGVGALSGALSAGIGAGVSSALAGGSFTAGFVGSTTAKVAAASFNTGALIGGASGFTGSFTAGFGSSLIAGKNFKQALVIGTIAGVSGGLTGAIGGGIYSGIKANKNGMDFWDGDIPLEERIKIIAGNVPDEQLSESGISEIKIGKHMGNRNGYTMKGDFHYRLPNGNIAYDDNTIFLSRSTVRSIWRGEVLGNETLSHELFHGMDFSSGNYTQFGKNVNLNSLNTKYVNKLTECIMEYRAFSMSYSRTGLSIYQSSAQHWYDLFNSMYIK